MEELGEGEGRAKGHLYFTAPLRNHARRELEKLETGKNELVQLAKDLEEKAKTDTHVKSQVPRCKEAGEHLAAFTQSVKAKLEFCEGLPESTAEDIVDCEQSELTSLLQAAKVHNEGMMLAIKSYKKWL